MPYGLIISARTASTVVGSPVEVQVTLENTSPEDLTLVKSGAQRSGELTYDVEVITASGSPAVLTPYGRALHGQPTNPPIVIRNSPREVTLKPHEKVVDTILLNKIYDLTPGSYIVRVRKSPENSPEAKIILSNTLKLTILPE
jgi:hypothetical protein